jgi:hypothetical protein
MCSAEFENHVFAESFGTWRPGQIDTVCAQSGLRHWKVRIHNCVEMPEVSGREEVMREEG